MGSQVPHNRETTKISSLDEVELVYDADSHVTEKYDDILLYMDDKYKGVRGIMENTSYPLSDVFSITMPTPGSPFQEPALAPEETMTYEKKIEQLDEYGIDKANLDPTLSSALNSVNNPQFQIALAKSYNNYILDRFTDKSSRLKATITSAPKKPNESADEIDDKGDEDGIVGVHLPPSGLVPPPGHEQYHPIYEAAENNGLPIIMHTVTTSNFLTFPVQSQWNETYALDHAIFHPFQHMWNLGSLVYNGIPEIFPDLNFVHQESGIGWVPYMNWRLDDHYMEHTHELPMVNKLPSEYIRDQFYFTTQPLGLTANNPEHIAWSIDMVGSSSVMYAADLPHHDFDPPGELFDRLYNYFDKSEVERIMGGNAEEVFTKE